MKKIILSLIILILLSSCEDKPEHYRFEFNDNNVIVIDSCEYFYYRTSYGYKEITHKGNCKFCKDRLEKLIEEKTK